MILRDKAREKRSWTNCCCWHCCCGAAGGAPGGALEHEDGAAFAELIDGA